MYKRRYCIVCGKEIASGVFCDEHKPINRDKKKTIEYVKICVFCNRVFFKGSWRQKLPNDIEVKRYEKVICPTCNNIISPKYNLVVQLRGDKSKFNFAINIIQKYAVIKDIEHLREGINVLSYATHKSIQNLYKIFKNIGGSVLITRKHVSRDRITSKNIYRVFLRVRL